MEKDFQIQPEQHYLHVVSRRKLTSGDMCSGWKQVIDESRRQGINRILCESRTGSKASPAEIYDCGKDLANLMFPSNVRIAFVCSDDNLEDTQLMETVLHNRRNISTEVFINQTEALNWLQKDS